MKVKIASAYITGRADTWLRGTGILLLHHFSSWKHFCTMLSDRFGEVSTYQVTDQFQSLEQTHSINQYIDKFEESLVLTKRDNPNLQDLFSSLSLSRPWNQTSSNLSFATNLKQYSMLTGMLDTMNRLIIPRQPTWRSLLHGHHSTRTSLGNLTSLLHPK